MPHMMRPHDETREQPNRTEMSLRDFQVALTEMRSKRKLVSNERLLAFYDIAVQTTVVQTSMSYKEIKGWERVGHEAKAIILARMGGN
jgi:phosphoribosylformylglycinamidine (FGAM) synthase-like enzyme